MEKNDFRYKRLQNENQARIIYNIFNGECFFLDNGTLKEFVINDLFVREELFEKIKELI